MSKHETSGFFERLKHGMEESISHSRGELNLKTMTLPSPPPPASSAKVVALRKKLKMSQSVFAATLNVSTKLVQSWEQGIRKPDNGDLRLIQLLMREPVIVSRLILAGLPSENLTKTSKNRKSSQQTGVPAA